MTETRLIPASGEFDTAALQDLLVRRSKGDFVTEGNFDESLVKLIATRRALHKIPD